jgi:hypothetical protein
MKKLSGLALIVMGLNSAYASSVAISYSAANNLILSAKTCSSLKTQHKAICHWKKNVDPSFTIPAITDASCLKNPKGGYTTTVSTCLLPFVKTNQHKKLYRAGGNCWGTALSFKKLSTRPRFIWSNEITYWLDSPVCRKLNPDEAKQPGDLLSMYGPEYSFGKEESTKGDHFWDSLFPGRVTVGPVQEGYSGYHHFLHTETFITNEVSFGKDSPSKDDKFEFHEMSDVYGRPDAVECQENQTMSPYLREFQNPPKPIKDSKCDYFSLAHRCEAFPDYFAKQNLTESDREILKTIAKLQAVQDKLFPLTTVLKITLPNAEMKQMLKLADDTAKETLEELGRQSVDKNREMLLTLKYFTASGIRKSLEQADLIPPTEEL